MGISDFSISNILLGKGAIGGKIIGHVIACSKNPVCACASCLFQRAIGSRCINCIDNLNRIIINIGKLQIIRRQCHCATFCNLRCIIRRNWRIIGTGDLNRIVTDI